MKNNLLYVLLIIILLTMVFFGNRAYTHAKSYEKSTALLVEQMSAKKLAAFQLKELAENFSFGLYKMIRRKILKL
jgi:hypothetical protein